MSTVWYRSGDELSPTDRHGRFELAVRADGTARLEHHQLCGSRAWSARLEEVVWPRLLASLRRASFPAIEVPSTPAGATLRRIEVVDAEPAGELAVWWHGVAETGLGEAFRILDSLVRQVSGGEVRATVDSLPPLAHAVGRDRSLPEPDPGVVGTATFGTVTGGPGYAVFTADRRLRLFAVPGQEPRGSGVRVAEPERALALGRAGEQEIVTAGGDGRVVWAWDTRGLVLHARNGPHGAVRQIATTVDGDLTLIAAAGSDGRIWTWLTGTNEDRGAIAGWEGAAFNGVASAQVGGRHLLAACGDDGKVRTWDLETAMGVHTLRAHSGWINAIAMYGSGDWGVLASGGGDGMVHTWDLRKKTAQTLAGHTAGVVGLAYLVHGDRLILGSCALDGTVRTWDPTSGAALRSWSIDSEWPTAITAMRLGERPVLVTADADGGVRVWDADAGAPVTTLATDFPASAVTAIAAGRVGGDQVLVAGHQDGTLRYWDPARGELVGTVETPDGAITGLAFATEAGPAVLVCGTDNGTVRVHNATDGTEAQVLTPHTDSVLSLAFATVEGRELIISGGADRDVRIWDAATGDPVRRLRHPAGVAAVAAGRVHDAVLIASAGYDGVVRTWDPVTGAELPGLWRHPFPVYQLAFGTVHGGPVLASGGYDGTVRVGFPESGATPLELHGNDGLVTALSFGTVSEDTVLVVACDTGVVRLWRLPDGELLAELATGTRPLAVWLASPETLYVVDLAGKLLTLSPGLAAPSA